MAWDPVSSPTPGPPLWDCTEGGGLQETRLRGPTGSSPDPQRTESQCDLCKICPKSYSTLSLGVWNLKKIILSSVKESY